MSKNKGGRPSLYTPELVETIAERLATGEPLAQICREAGFPHPSTVRDWMATNEDVSLRIARAREDGFDAIAMEALRIADTPIEGLIDKMEQVLIENPDGPELPPVKELQLTERKREDMLGHRKLQVETRLKLLAKWDPKRYGDRQVLAGDPEAPLVANNEAQLDARITALLGLRQEP